MHLQIIIIEVVFMKKIMLVMFIMVIFISSFAFSQNNSITDNSLVDLKSHNIVTSDGVGYLYFVEATKKIGIELLVGAIIEETEKVFVATAKALDEYFTAKAEAKRLLEIKINSYLSQLPYPVNDVRTLSSSSRQWRTLSPYSEPIINYE
jgi:hypothetical protein